MRRNPTEVGKVTGLGTGPGYRTLMIITRTKGGTGKMKTARDHQFEVGTCLEEIKQFQDRVLDIYDPKDQKKIALLKELVSLQAELEDLDKEFEKYVQENC
jgi:hypothetical protein